MSIRFWNWAWSQEQLTTVETLLLLSLSDMADDTGQSFPGIKTLAKRCRTSERTIQRCIAALKGKGLVQVRPRIVGGQQTSNFYILIADLSAPQAKKGQGDKLSPGVVDVIPVATSDAATGDSHVVTDRPKGATEDRRNGATSGWLKRDSNGVSGCGVFGVFCNR